MHDVKGSPKPALLRGGDVFILDGLPANFTIGCDATSFNSTKPFPGFRDIPPGVHFIWVAPSESTSSRSGFWICTPEKDDVQPGCVYEQSESETLERRFSSLSPYHLRAASTESSHKLALSEGDEDPPDLLGDQNIWFQLTSAIRPDLLNRITGQAQNTWHVSTTDSVLGDATSAEEARLYASGMSHLRFTFPMDARLINPEATGAERTRQALDPTGWMLDKLEGRQ
ncbi:hypothetical protein NUW58_g10062 [Xylaria curta]|uniref:Uncharacterized protein n=1 Tax=Xylaria curta TaxID=42375 RepID=A0ACC1MQY0_9PEZI|nr:hypothetical protein NUW58_g10062 [Xylaria curta]